MAPAALGEDLTRALKDAALAAVVALILAIPLVGFQTLDLPSGLGIATRWETVAYGVAAVFVGRLYFAIEHPGVSALLGIAAGVALAFALRSDGLMTAIGAGVAAAAVLIAIKELRR